MPASFPINFDAGTVQGRGLAVDISMAGCTFHTEVELVEGNILQMRLDVPEETSPVRVEAVIIRTLRAGRVGVEFVQFKTVRGSDWSVSFAACFSAAGRERNFSPQS